MTALLGLGPHVFEILPLSLQRLEERTRANWVSIQRLGKQSARQLVGFGDDEFRIDGVFWTEEWGGMGDYMALKQSLRAGRPVDLIGWGDAAGYATVFGPVVILEVGSTHEHIGRQGVGRKVEFSLELAPAGGDGPYGGLF